MFFKSQLCKFKILLLLTLATSVSCSLRTNESASDTQRTMKIKSITCMRQVSEKFDSFVENKMSNSDIDAYSLCLQNSLQSFLSFAKGESENSYSRDELKKAAENILFPDKTISAELMNSAFELKMMVVGGNANELTFNEAKLLIKFVGYMDQALKLAQPHIAFLLAEQNKKQDDFKIALAVEVIKNQLLFLFEKMKLNSDEIDMANFETFWREYRLQVDHSLISHSKFMLFYKLKDLVTGSDLNSVIKKEDLHSSVQSLARLGALYFKYTRGLKSQDLLVEPGLRQLTSWISDSLGFLKEISERSPNGVIEFKRIDELVDNLEECKFLPEFLRKQSIKAIIHPVFEKIFGDTMVEFAQRNSIGIDLPMINRIENEFQYWKEIQSYIAKNYQIFFDNSKFRAMNSLNGFFLNTNLDNPQVDELREVVVKLLPMHFTNDPRVFLANARTRSRYGIQHNYYQLSLLNLIRAGVRLVIRGYATDVVRAQNMEGLNEFEVQNFVSAIHLIAEDLNLLPPGKLDAGKRIFLEGNMFTYSSGEPLLSHAPPDSIMTMEEGIEEVSYLYSSYDINKAVYAKMTNICPTGSADIFGRKMIEKSCFMEHLSAVMAKEMRNMPHLSIYLSTLNYKTAEALSQKNEFNEVALELMTLPTEKSDWISYVNVGKLTMVFHYLETLLTRFDTNEDLVIDDAESEASFYLFEDVIGKLAEQKCFTLDHSQRLGVFKYLLKNAKVPKGRWDIFSNNPFFFFKSNIHLDRLQGLKVFKVLMNLPPPEYCD